MQGVNLKGKTNLLKEKIEELETHFKGVNTTHYTFVKPPNTTYGGSYIEDTPEKSLTF